MGPPYYLFNSFIQFITKQIPSEVVTSSWEEEKSILNFNRIRRGDHSRWGMRRFERTILACGGGVHHDYTRDTTRKGLARPSDTENTCLSPICNLHSASKAAARSEDTNRNEQELSTDAIIVAGHRRIGTVSPPERRHSIDDSDWGRQCKRKTSVRRPSHWAGDGYDLLERVRVWRPFERRPLRRPSVQSFQSNLKFRSTIRCCASPAGRGGPMSSPPPQPFASLQYSVSGQKVVNILTKNWEC